MERLPEICPDLPLQKQSQWRLLTQSLGDGYETRQLNGINALQVQWTVSWSGRRVEDILELETFLADQGAAPFLFKDPSTQVEFAVFCDGWNSEVSGRLRGGGEFGQLQATFRRAYGYK